MLSTRRTMLLGSATIAIATGARAADAETVTIGINVPLTGAQAEDATAIQRGATLAVEDANAAGGPGGVHVEIQTLDDGTATAGQYDPSQAATNAHKFATDRKVVGIVGPENSGSGKAMSAILSAANLATVTPAATNPDLTDPKYAALYRPAGKPVFFRTVTTDAFQGPNMANFMLDKLGMKSVFVLDDSGSYGVGLADAFQAHAAKRGMNVMGRDRLDPMQSDYTPILTRIRGLNPQALYFGGNALAGVKLVKQSYDLIPTMVKAGGDGMHGVSILTGGGFPAAEGWYATIAAPHMLDDSLVVPWVERYRKRFGAAPSDYSITAYDAAQVILNAIATVAKSGKKVTRDSVRDAIQTSTQKTLQGDIAFDANGDLQSHVVSVFRIHHDPNFPNDDIIHQFQYIGTADAS